MIFGEFWRFLDGFREFSQAIKDFERLSESFGEIWRYLKSFEEFLESFREFWVCFGDFGFFWRVLKSFGRLPKNFREFQGVLVSLEIRDQSSGSSSDFR